MGSVRPDDDCDGTGELNNAAGSVGGQWNFFGNPSDFTPVHGWTDTNPQPGGGFGGGLPFFPGGTLLRPNHAMRLATAIGSWRTATLAVASLFTFGCYAVGNSVLIPPRFRKLRGIGPQSLARCGIQRVGSIGRQSDQVQRQDQRAVPAEFFNLFNHPIFCNPNGVAGGANSTPGDPTEQPIRRGRLDS